MRCTARNSLFYVKNSPVLLKSNEMLSVWFSYKSGLTKGKSAHECDVFFSLLELFPLSGFGVIQPQNLTVTPSATISCEHNANVKSVKDIRLNAISQYVPSGIYV